jgi:hypothetical protein
MLCEKAVLGFCALHHLLLYLQHKNRKLVTSFADRTVAHFVRSVATDGKRACKDLGKLLIYTMISAKYRWKNIAKRFVLESFTRNVRWMVKQRQFAKYNTTKSIFTRSKAAFTATSTSRRLIMFQVWFSQNMATETLKSYNQRLGRPRSEVRRAILPKTKGILECGKWRHYFDALGLSVDPKDVDQLLRFAVFNSMVMGYHRPDRRMMINPMAPPKMFQKVYSKKVTKPGGAAAKSEKKATKRRVSVHCKVALNKLLGDAAKERLVLSEKAQKNCWAKRAEERAAAICSAPKPVRIGRYSIGRYSIRRYSICRPSPPQSASIAVPDESRTVSAQSTEHTVSSTANVPKRPEGVHSNVVQQTSPSQSTSVVVPTVSTVDRAAVSPITVSAAANVPERTTVSTPPRTVPNVVNAVPNKLVKIRSKRSRKEGDGESGGRDGRTE